MDRAIPIGNKLCHAKEHKKQEERRKQRLREMKPQIDARAPEVCGMRHLKINFKRDEMLGCRYDEIERDNRHLLNKMSSVVKEDGQGSPIRKRKTLNLSNSAPVFPGGPARRNEIARIEFENQRLLKRLQNAQAEYRTKDWEAAHDESRNYVRRICEYPVLKPKRRARSTASLVPLPAQGADPMDGRDQAGTSFSAFAPDYASSPPGQFLRYVLKKAIDIDGTSFLVEMATDGQTLAISAYDSAVQDTLELLVNEENHRQLLAESQSDYGQIALRLRVDSGRLVIRQLEEAFDDQVSSIPDASP
jgi:hypothetical protein